MGIGNPHAVELEVAEGPCAVDAVDPGEGHVRRRHHEQAEHPEARRGDDDLVDLGAAQHLPLVAAQHPAVAVAGGGGADAEGISARLRRGRGCR